MRPLLFILIWGVSVGYAIGQVGIGITTPHPSAMLDVTSTNKGFLPPRMTTAERNAIATPAAGLTIYNTTVNCLQWYNGTYWVDGCGNNFVTTLTCANVVNTGTLVSGVLASGVSSSVPYMGGNGGTHAGQMVTSTGVTGLTATLTAGSFALGAGNLTYNISGTPGSSGTASFALSIGGQICTLQLTVAAGSGSITTLTCASAVNTGTLTPGVLASGVSSSVPYTGGNGGTHTGQMVTSTGVTGLTATLTAGSFALGAGNLTYNIGGTPGSSGTASFALSIGGQMCTLQLTVDYCTNSNYIPIAVIDTLPRGFYKDEIYFINSSTGNISSILWDFGDGFSGDEQNPFHFYPYSGTYLVSLVVTNIFGCKDTAQMTVVVPEFVQLPKVITPNGGGFNDKFIIPVSGNNEFELIIKNRSGEVVFTSKAARLAWDGTSQSGIPMPQGTYYYILKEVGSKDYYKQGSFTLLRE